ncbi:MAG: hypothetical protein LC646_06235, partial [Xanthomonadaceae bacterium]|nr:hypothetical protein [Xanthomonadaceae bacterium]
SILLSLVVSLIMALIFYYRSKETANKMLFNTLFLVIGMSVASFAVVTINRIISLLGSMGGKAAEGTAMGRLQQYEYAYSLIVEYPILGVDGAYYAKFGPYVSGIHNMWLGQLAYGGFISALLLFSLLFMMFRISLQLLQNPKTRSYGTVTIGYMFAVLVSTLFYPGNTQFFWALLGMNAAIVTTLRSTSMTR